MTREQKRARIAELTRKYREQGSKSLSAEERAEYLRLTDEEEIRDIDTRGVRGNVTTVTRENARIARERRHLIGRDTSDLPAPGDGRPLEARHDMAAYLSQRKDYNPSGMDWGSFDKNAFYRQLLTGNQAGREYRALAEGSQSVTASGGGWLAPIGFSSSVLPLLRANLVWTSPGADGTINGPMVHDMSNQVEYVPVWQGDGSGLFSWLAENAQMTPTTSTLGVQKLTAYTMAGVVLSSRQLVEDSTADVAELIESNMALGAMPLSVS